MTHLWCLTLAIIIGMYFVISSASDINCTGVYYLEIRDNKNHTSGIPQRHKQNKLIKKITIESNPPANFSIYRNGNLLENNTKLNIKVTNENVTNTCINKLTLILNISQEDVEDSGLYTIVARNIRQGILQTKNHTYDLRKISGPTVLPTPNNADIFCEFNKTTRLQCLITGYPLPTVSWDPQDGNWKRINTNLTFFQKQTIVEVPCLSNLNISCVGRNKLGDLESPTTETKHTFHLWVDELRNGFGIKNADKIGSYSEEEDITIECLASLQKFSNVTWWLNGVDINHMVNFTQSLFSHVAKLTIHKSKQKNTGTYICRGMRNNGTTEEENIAIKIDPWIAPVLNLSSNFDGPVIINKDIDMYCVASGVPQPTIMWKKDNEELQRNVSNILIRNFTVDKKTTKSTIHIDHMNENNTGTYMCVATNMEGDEVRKKHLILEEKHWGLYVIIICVFSAMLMAVVVFLVIKLRRDMAKRARLREELAAAGLLNFYMGQTQSLNKALGIDRQADLLPYNQEFEFPPENLILEKQIGSGAFGVVYKAEAHGIIEGEETTIVAVKKVQPTADSIYLKALVSELKILVHLGKHLNIVNLLGACTRDVCKRQFSVILEYCEFGSIHTYMQKHRDVFIDQFADNTELDKQTKPVNREYGSGSNGVQTEFVTGNSQDTYSMNKKTAEGYVCVQHEWRSNYVSDYSEERNKQPLKTLDLLAWAFQIARGMEYLASRKILHGDLAARNILLAKDNIVKICDFGLARNIYENDIYKKNGNDLLPWNWLAIECMTDSIYSTQSDVWSFGVVLWELFTLAKVPYPNMRPHDVLDKLLKGYRLDKPEYSDDRIYEVMRSCWEIKPTMRPSFTQIQERLGSFLEENVRNYYMDMDIAYKEQNKIPEGQEDYLAMVSAPDYNNMVVPSTNYYNETNHSDANGDLKLTPKLKPDGLNIVFDPRYSDLKSLDASDFVCELTPMLNSNNMRRNASGSVQDGLFLSHNGCPAIDEEALEELTWKENNGTSNFCKAKGTLATNSMYLTYNDININKKTT